MKRPIESDYISLTAYTRALEAYCEAFAKLVREEATAKANAKANASWTLMCEKMVAIEREACAKLFPQPHMEYFGRDIQDAIRARGEA